MSSSKRTANTGCHECNRRRIKCDLTVPECQKCLKKGLQCSGPGKFRFNVGLATRGKLRSAGFAATKAPNPQEKKFFPSCLKWKPMHARIADRFGSEVDLKRHHSSREAEYSEEKASSETGYTNFYCQNVSNFPSDKRYNRQAVVAPSLDPVSLKSQEQFSYFSLFVAPTMVSFSDLSNGFIEYVLPMAHENTLLRDAVCFTSEHHRAIRCQSFSKYSAARQRASIVSRLMSMSLDIQNNSPDAILAVILTLLIGEMVTGNDQFRPLINSLNLFTSGTVQLRSRDQNFRFFMAEQALGFQFLADPFITRCSDEPIPLDVRLGEYFTDCGHFTPSDPFLRQRSDELLEVHQIVRQMHQLIEDGALPIVNALLSRLKGLLVNIESGSPGEHVLIWVYFIAGLAHSSSGQDGYEFYVNRLRHIYYRTFFQNILIGIQYLENRHHNRRPEDREFDRLRDFGSIIL